MDGWLATQLVVDDAGTNTPCDSLMSFSLEVPVAVDGGHVFGEERVNETFIITDGGMRFNEEEELNINFLIDKIVESPGTTINIHPPFPFRCFEYPDLRT